MVLTHLGESIDYDRLRRMLGTTEYGTPFSNIRRLTSLGLFIEQDEHEDDLSLLTHYIELRLPVIVGVNTLGLSYWPPTDTNHAVVVVGLSGEHVYLNDPAFEDAPQVASANDFLYAWSFQDFRYAIIGLAEPG
jgi:ABC-type bacteriocin/lantibiotic exporter with double-glycine peptidase domain